MNKSPDAFRTISEVADLLETPAHVLRFWESRFPQIRPVKRAGGRRYYRPADVALLTGIKRLLHEDGLTIRGVQKILREQGVRHVSGVADDSPDTDGEDDLANALVQATGAVPSAVSLPPAEAETAQIIALQAALREPVAQTVTPGDVVPPQEDPESSGPETDLPAGWQDESTTENDPGDDLADNRPPVIAEPPPPATSAPVVADLFSRVAPPPLPAPPEPPVAEAPMAVWADEPETPQGEPPVAAPPTALRITRIGGPPAPAPAPAEPTPIAVADTPVVSGPTLAQRLRAVSASDLAPADRQRLSEIRDQALALRGRLSGPARAQG